MENKIKIALFAEIKNGKVSGPTNSVTLLSKSLNENGVICDVFTIVGDSGVEVINDVSVKSLSYFYSNISEYQLCILEGAFRLGMWRVALSCKLNKIKYIISPRSNLMISSIKKGFLKKILSLPLVLTFFRAANGVHFLSSEELLNSFKFFNKNNYICRNGVSDLILEIPFKSREKVKEVVFIGRYDIYHKGLDLLLDFINRNQNKLRENNFHFSLYGPDYRGGKSYMIDYILRYSFSDLVSINEPVFGDEKNNLLNKTTFFIHTSRYEGQPQAVLEAIGCGCIPIVSNGCNLNHLIKQLNYGVYFDDRMDVDDFIFHCEAASVFPENLHKFKALYKWQSVAIHFKTIIKEVVSNG